MVKALGTSESEVLKGEFIETFLFKTIAPGTSLHICLHSDTR